MKIYKIIALILALCTLCSLFIACEEDTPEDTVKYVNVTLDYNDGTPPHVVKVESEKKMTRPIDPTREGYIFSGWKSNGKEWNFEEFGLVNDVTLTAMWINASSLFEYTLDVDGTVRLVTYTGSLQIVNIPATVSGNTVSSLGDGLFTGLANRTPGEISVPESVTSVGANAFLNVSNSKVTLLGDLTNIGESAFAGCKALSTVKLANGLQTIPYNAFSSTSLEAVDIPESVRIIDENAFYGCTNLKTIVLPKGVEIRNSAFSDCEALVTVFFLGNEAEWQEVLSMLDNGGGENNAIINARVMFYSDTEPEDDGEFWHRNKDGEPRGW